MTDVPETRLPQIVNLTDTAAPLIVCIPGSGYDARYFDAPGFSFLQRLAEGGHPAVSITRTGYPADEVSARHRPSFAQSAAILDDVIADVWTRCGSASPGVVLLGHSVGGSISLHLAARRPAWPLLGVAVSGVGDRPAGGAVAHFGQIEADRPLSMSFRAVRSMFYGPVGSYDESLEPALADLLVPMPAGDPVEVNTSWPADLPAVAGAIIAPVFHAFAEHERLWETGEVRLAAFSRLFGSARFVESHVIEGCSHNIEHHYAAEAYAQRVAAFADRCAG